jgi:hypothetical protein
MSPLDTGGLDAHSCYWWNVPAILDTDLGCQFG